MQNMQSPQNAGNQFQLQGYVILTQDNMFQISLHLENTARDIQLKHSSDGLVTQVKALRDAIPGLSLFMAYNLIKAVQPKKKEEEYKKPNPEQKQQPAQTNNESTSPDDWSGTWDSGIWKER